MHAKTWALFFPSARNPQVTILNYQNTFWRIFSYNRLLELPPKNWENTFLFKFSSSREQSWLEWWKRLEVRQLFLLQYNIFHTHCHKYIINIYVEVPQPVGPSCPFFRDLVAFRLSGLDVICLDIVGYQMLSNRAFVGCFPKYQGFHWFQYLQPSPTARYGKEIRGLRPQSSIPGQKNLKFN